MMISVIVPVYNNAEDLPRCLDSILAQEFDDIEIVAVNDGSTDASGAILDHYGQKYANIRVIHKENGGVTAARLAGVAAATGAYIGFSDADDTMDPDFYARLLHNLKETEADISHCGFRMAFSDGRVRYFYNTGVRETHDGTTARKELLSGARIEPSLCTKLFRRELFSGLQTQMPEDIRNNEDLLMNYLLFSRAKLAIYDDFCGYCYYVQTKTPQQLRLNTRKIADTIRVKQIILDTAPEALQSDAQKALLSTCINVYNTIILEKSPQLEEDRRKVRQMILGQKHHRKLLSRRQRLLGAFICHFPFVYAPFYRFYVKHFQKNPYL